MSDKILKISIALARRALDSAGWKPRAINLSSGGLSEADGPAVYLVDIDHHTMRMVKTGKGEIAVNSDFLKQNGFTFEQSIEHLGSGFAELCRYDTGDEDLAELVLLAELYLSGTINYEVYGCENEKVAYFLYGHKDPSEKSYWLRPFAGMKDNVLSVDEVAEAIGHVLMVDVVAYPERFLSGAKILPFRFDSQKNSHTPR